MVGPIPAIAISFVRMFPTPATIAFGGVPTCNYGESKFKPDFNWASHARLTGMWKAKQQLRAAGYINNMGCFPMTMAISPKTGRMTLAMATFEVNSVKVWQTKQIKNKRTKKGSSLKTSNDDPNIFDIPDTLPPSASAKPPPSKKTSDLKWNLI